MHDYPKIASRCASFSLMTLSDAQDRILKELETSGATRLIMALQMVGLQKAVTAVGIFSLFEANLQGLLKSEDAFREAKKILKDRGAQTLADEFEIYYLAINVLKHGRGRSYDALIKNASALPFKIKLPDQSFFFEGDVGEVSTEIEVDDQFVTRCAGIVEEVYEVLTNRDSL